MKFLAKYQNFLRRLGFIMLIAGCAFAYWAADAEFFAQLPIYARVLTLLPAVCAWPLLHAPTFADWQVATEANRIRAGGSLVMVAVVLIGTISWFLLAPDART